MKTEQEIKDWLKSQEWFEEYKHNLEQGRKSNKEKYLNGESMSGTISGAFLWHATKEGNGYWHDIDVKFAHWFNGE